MVVGDKINTIEVLKYIMCMHYSTKQVVSFYTGISIPAYHLHIKDGQGCAVIMLVQADCLGAARPSSVLYWALSLSVGHL